MVIPRLRLDDELKLRALWALAIALAALAAGETWALVNFQPLGVDFLPLWTAGRMAWTDPGHVYDFAAVQSASAGQNGSAPNGASASSVVGG